jgi:4-amino-4-deoxy-L-arabinose transferase-like glycosyltransferase
MFVVDAAAGLVLVAALALAAWRLGRVAAARWLPPSPEAELMATALALGLIAHAVLAIGLLGALGRWLPAVVVVAGALSLPAARAAFAGRLRARTLAVGAALALLPLALALLPPTAWDATSYHMALDRFYARAHRITPAWQLRYPVFPQLTDVLGTVGYLAGGAVGGALTEALFAALTAAALYRWGARYASPRAGAVAAALWLGQPMIVFLATTQYVDAGLTFYATLATLAVGSAWLDGDERWLAAAGLAIGFAAGCKYLALPFAVILFVAVLLAARRRLRAAFVFAAAALLVAWPWYLYDFVHTHNPVFPFAASWFGYGPWSPADLALQLEDLRSHGVGRSLRALVLLPWSLTVAQGRFQVEAPFVPLFLPALAFAAWAAARDRRVRALLAVVVAYGLFWFFGMQLLRYLALASALFCLALAMAAERVRRPARIDRWLPLALVAPSLVYAAARLRDGFPVGAAAREAYLVRHLTGYDALAALNRARPTGYRAFGLHLERLQLFADGTLLGDWFGPYRYRPVYERLADAPALAAYLRGLGADTLIVPTSEQPAARLHAPDYAAVFEVVAEFPDATTLRLR